jgi:phthiodiolone/phenolphthiodiolone dimycocerosates ketoreductase
MVAMPKIAVGLHIPPQPPLGAIRSLVFFARLIRLDSITVADHFQSLFPTTLWDKQFLWIAGQNRSPHEYLEYQTLLGYLASRAGKLRIGVGVTEPIRRHPVLIAQAMLTLSHMTKRAPILGIGAGERENIEPYGMDFTTPVGRLEEALKVISMCFSSQRPIDFHGKYYHLDNAVMDLKAPKGKAPEVWIASHGPRMLRLTGIYGDGWYPTIAASPEEYAAMLEVIRAAAREAERDPEAITPALEPYIVVAPTEQEAQAMLGSKAGRYAALLFVPAEGWRKVGVEHPFGERFRGYVDFVPERYDRKTLEEAIAAVPPELVGRNFILGTPEQVVSRLRQFGEAGLRHVVLTLASALFSRRAAVYGLRATRTIARLLKNGG